MSKYINVINIETFDSDLPKPYCCGFVLNNITYIYYGEKCVINMLNRMFNTTYSGVVFFAHNLTFDGVMLLQNLPSNTAVCPKRTQLYGGDILTLCLKKDNSALLFKCLVKFLPMPLTAVAQAIGKGVEDRGGSAGVTVDNYSLPEIKDGAVARCNNNLKALKRILDIFEQNMQSELPDWVFSTNTISSIAIKLFKRKFNFHKICLELDTNTDNLVRDAYFGGRCEVFGNAYPYEYVQHFDFPSMYTHILLEKYPVGQPKYVQNPANSCVPGFYAVSIKSNNMHIPVLPYRCEETGRVLFPNGAFYGIYWYEELQLFEELGGQIMQIHWALIYPDGTAAIFADFAKFCLKKRQTGAGLCKILWKLIPNSLVGRLGLRQQIEKTKIVAAGTYIPSEYEVLIDKLIGDTALVRTRVPPVRDMWGGNVVYAAITTSKARVQWRRAAAAVADHGGRLLYCDTDSIYAAFPADVSGQQHGVICWPTGGNKILDSCFASSKAYAIKYADSADVKIKGVPRGVINFEEFKDYFYKEKCVQSPVEHLKKAGLNVKLLTVLTQVNLAGYNKRQFVKNKHETAPITVTVATVGSRGPM